MSYTYDTNHIRTWASFAIRNGDSFGGGTIDNLNVKNINVRDKGTTPGRLKGYSSTKMISNITFDTIIMPGSSTPAQNLYQMNFTDTSFYSGVTILPTQIPEPAQRTNLRPNPSDANRYRMAFAEVELY
ncbi:hypothetical protein [Paenibacillus alginolyticus]|uniref:Uncharacterized protein n=1 Tax=Paenibacillus alginolyticus TaxID=59839 RepID=A0ABT4GHK8_9BACL|nr:hypothetical protein [Paenibacillus alginolyticus]MCY9695677.1 hypothetical protein [Paenibacillus alginolyticus]MEC0142215.1 hypothetical protein [Paenibacillus alginolyticus]